MFLSNIISGAETEGMRLDTKTDVRICASSDVCLCKVETKKLAGRSNSIFLYLRFSTTYIPELCIYHAFWAIREGCSGKNEQYRLEIMDWKGGLPITLRSADHFQEALNYCVSLIASKKYEVGGGGEYTIEPVTEFRQAFIDSGWQETSAP
jgi:hypothetical protein